MAWRDISHVVECYGTDVSSNNDLEMDITLPSYQVTGISFTRKIHRPIEGIDVLLGQMREDEEMFDFFAHLHVMKLLAQYNFQERIIGGSMKNGVKIHMLRLFSQNVVFA
ncbi:unnamed protein product [Brassica rapa subsp. narinosa]